MGDDPLKTLIHELSRLPGIGERTATRLAFFILKGPEQRAQELAAAIVEVKKRLSRCSSCCMLTSHDPCSICSDQRRDQQIIMVVSSPQDLIAFEKAGGYNGLYHVLHGQLSPLDGIGPDELTVKLLMQRLASSTQISEVVLATNPNVEGDTTALYLSGLIKPFNIAVSRIASGVPIGGELEYADGVTLHRALEARQSIA